jgi:hypothetical protein
LTENRNNAGFSALSAVKRRAGMAALRRRRFIWGHKTDGRFAAWTCPKYGRNERPVRGDNRTGQAIWALGVDGRSRRIQPRWGGITAPTPICRGRGAARSTGLAIFLTFLARIFGGIFGRKIIAGRRDWLRRRPTCPRPWRRPAAARPWWREPAAGPELFQRQAGRKPRRPASPARRRR